MISKTEQLTAKSWSTGVGSNRLSLTVPFPTGSVRNMYLAQNTENSYKTISRTRVEYFPYPLKISMISLVSKLYLNLLVYDWNIFGSSLTFSWSSEISKMSSNVCVTFRQVLENFWKSLENFQKNHCQYVYKIKRT